jgi:hypothetical protein
MMSDRTGVRIPICTLAASMALLVASVMSQTARAGAEPDAALKVTFDGSTCIYEGPDQVVPGDVEVTFENQSGEFAGLGALELPLDESARLAEMSNVYSDWPTPAEPDPDGAQFVGGVLAAPGEVVTQVTPMPAGGYVLDCAIIEGDAPSRAWRAVRPVWLEVG